MSIDVHVRAPAGDTLDGHCSQSPRVLKFRRTHDPRVRLGANFSSALFGIETAETTG